MTSLIGIALVLLGLAQDAPVDVSVTLEPPVIPFHKQARYTISVEAPADLEVRLPEMMERFGGLEVYGVPEFRMQSLGDGRRRIAQTYVLDPILIGDYAIQPAEVSWGEGNENKASVPSPGLRVRDLTEEERAAAEHFETIEGPVDPPPGLFRDWRFWTASGVAAALIAALVTYVWRRRTRRAQAAPALPPWEHAYQQLRDLDGRQLPRAGKYELFYVGLSSILRRYIEERFHVRAPEQTTPEFLTEASSIGLFSDGQQKVLAGFLRHCDRVKFAQYRPTLEQMEYGFAQVLRFVDETVPKPPDKTQEEAAA